MTELAIGIAVIWIVDQLRQKDTSAKGLPSILLLLVIAYGLGSIVTRFLP